MSVDLEKILNNARTLAEAGKNEEAQMCLLAILKEDPDNIAALLMLGGAYFVEHNLKEASMVFERLISIDPESGKYSIALFNALWQQQRAEEALEEIRRFISVADKEAEKDTIEQYMSILKSIDPQKDA
jgi:tetratricopeptide (TPR) repeat protein